MKNTDNKIIINLRDNGILLINTKVGNRNNEIKLYLIISLINEQLKHADD